MQNYTLTIIIKPIKYKTDNVPKPFSMTDFNRTITHYIYLKYLRRNKEKV